MIPLFLSIDNVGDSCGRVSVEFEGDGVVTMSSYLGDGDVKCLATICQWVVDLGVWERCGCDGIVDNGVFVHVWIGVIG